MIVQQNVRVVCSDDNVTSYGTNGSIGKAVKPRGWITEYR